MALTDGRAKLTVKPVQALKYDDEKPRFDLIPARPLIDVARLFEFGARKYAARNWERGMPWGKLFAALQRHAWTWWLGDEPLDPETFGAGVNGAPLSHMTAVAWNALCLAHFELECPEWDDRKWTNEE